jgi:hypothetical protein
MNVTPDFVLQRATRVISKVGARMIFRSEETGPRNMPQFWKAESSNSFRVRYAVKSNGGSLPRESDLVFVNERPFVVLEWSEIGAATVTIELDPAKLRVGDAIGRVYDYSELLIDPR